MRHGVIQVRLEIGELTDGAEYCGGRVHLRNPRHV